MGSSDGEWLFRREKLLRNRNHDDADTSCSRQMEQRTRSESPRSEIGKDTCAFSLLVTGDMLQV